MRYAVLATFAIGCVASASPRFPDDVAASIAHHDMRRLDTDELVVYYPAGRQEEAVRVARQITTCLTAARGHAPRGGRPRVVMPDLPLNNAFVLPKVAGYEDVAVVPTHNTLDFATEFGLPPDPGHIGCHEITHYVHAQQIAGFWKAVDTIFGEVLTPQLGLDVWFWEGLATYYEQQGGAGRLRWPVWNALFDAAYAGRGVDGDDFSELGREASVGHHYLVGSHFIAWLIDTYGEDRLWEVVARQANATAFLIDVNGRFRRAYGKSLSRLIGEFSQWVARMPRRAAAAGQERLRTIGDEARYARGADGSEAWVAADADVPAHLDVRGPDGRLRTSVYLVDVIAPRKLVMGSPLLVSGMAFADDGTLYLTVVDLGTTYQTTRLLRVRPGGDIDVIRNGLGPGMTVSGDGARYWAAEVDGDAWGLAEIDLATRARRVVIAPEPGRYVLRVAVRGDRALVSEWDGRHFDVALYRTGEVWTRERVLDGEPGAPAYDASWIDDDRAMYLAPVDGRFQVWVAELASGNRTAVTDAPFGAFQPAAAAGTVRFLDRDGWSWHLAEVALPPPSPPAEPVAAGETITIAAPGVVAGGGLAAADIEVRRDRPYSIFDGLFVPQLHALALAQPLDGTALFGLGLSGGDHLGLQRWAVTGLVHPSPKPARYGWAVGYSNAMLAPWILTAAAQDLRWHHGIETDPDHAGFEDYADRDAFDASVTVARTFRGTTSLATSAVYTRDNFADVPTPYRRLGGAQLAFAHDSAEATRSGGVRRRLALALSSAHYPARFSSRGDPLVDTRAELIVTVPVLGTRRHALTFDFRHRDLWESRGSPLLVVGGGPFAPLWTRRDPDVTPPGFMEPFLPERLRFTEPLRGFEDLEFPTIHFSVAEAAWRYPVVIDSGWATSLSILPAILLREFDFDVFGTAARTGVDPHYAAGASLTASLYLWRVPLLLRYQAARRFTDDEAWTQEVGIAVGL